jgi:CheY-like chemotaxis protein
MEAIGQLTGGVAHDFNNMLAIIVGSLNMLSRRLKDAEPGIRKYIEAAQEGASRAAQLTRHLLAFSRQQALNPRIVELNQLVTGMSELLKGALGRDVILETVIGQGTWKVHVDQNQLESAILNVALNARDAMTGGGRLTIETQNADLEERSAAASLGVTCGQYAMISITDTGTGMPPQIAERAFDPFFTTKGIGKGTGLGLSQVYGFVKQSGGTVKIQSEPEKGTSIKIYLPRHYGTQDAEPIPHAEPLQEGNEELILVVDDEDGVRDLAVDALRELGYRVLEASNAHVAMDLLKEYPAIDLLFTDIIMPETNGRKLADQARQIRPDLKVLFTSGYTRNAVVPNGLVEPDGLLIGKPYSLDQLAEKVREVLDVQH